MESTFKHQCSNCKCWRLPESFIGQGGQIVKRCLKCREKDRKQKKKPEVIAKRNERQRQKKYYVQYRKKKKEENEEEYLQHNASIMKAWRDKNSQHLKRYRTKNVNSRLTGMRQQAQKKGLEWSIQMTRDICESLMRSPCVYCGFLSNETLNGIDRLDSKVGYSVDNCVGCCKVCNFMKTCLDPITYVKRCQHISLQYGGQGEVHTDVSCDTRAVNYQTYMKRALKKDLEFILTKESFQRIQSESCNYCKKDNTATHQNGIDRKDNKRGYTNDNCVSCCGECNYMKGTLSIDEFINQCKRVASYAIVRDSWKVIPLCFSSLRISNIDNQTKIKSSGAKTKKVLK